MSVSINVKAKTKVVYNGKNYGEHSAQRDVLQPTSISEAVEMLGENRCMAYLLAAWRIATQANIRTDITNQVLEANGVDRAEKRTMTPEEKRLLTGIKALSIEKQKEIAKILDISL